MEKQTFVTRKELDDFMRELESLKSTIEILSDEEMMSQNEESEKLLKQGVKIALEIFEQMKDKKFDINKFELAYIRLENGKIERIDGEDIKNFVK